MRLLICVQNYHPAYSFGGTVTNAVALAEGLCLLGHDVTVVTSTVVDRKSRAIPRTHKAIINGVEIYYLGTWVKIGKVSVNPAVITFCVRHVRKFDAVHIMGLYDALGVFVARAARMFGIPYSVEPSGMVVPIVRSLRRKRLYLTLLGRSMLNEASATIVTSQNEWADCVRFGIAEDRLKKRWNGTNLKAEHFAPGHGSFRKRLGIDDSSYLILSLGRIEAKKNLEELIEALSGLREDPWILAIAGPSESKAYLLKLRQLVVQRGIEDRVHFLPGLYDENKLAAYSDADLFVLVSVSENWGNTVQEAIAAGVPVLVTHSCGVAEAIAGRGGVVVDRGVEAIRAGLHRLIADNRLYLRLKAELPALAAELTWERPVHQMSSLFESWRHDTPLNISVRRLRI